MIDYNKRYQVGMNIYHLYPLRRDNLCACGCGKELAKRKKRWFSKNCQNNALTNFYIIKGDITVIRKKLFESDQGYCRACGTYTENWQADHITPVYLGGSACGIDNFQTLCVECHKEKTYNDAHKESISLQASSILELRRETALGATSCVLPKHSIETESLVSALG